MHMVRSADTHRVDVARLLVEQFAPVKILSRFLVGGRSPVQCRFIHIADGDNIDFAAGEYGGQVAASLSSHPYRRKLKVAVGRLAKAHPGKDERSCKGKTRTFQERAA